MGNYYDLLKILVGVHNIITDDTVLHCEFFLSEK